MNEHDMQHGHDWHHSGQSIDGWLVSEKFDGVRAEWDGEKLWTRGGNRVPAPAWFTDSLPVGLALSGEIWSGRGNFTEARLAAQYGGRHFTRSIKFCAFDAPLEKGNWNERMAAIKFNSVIQPVLFHTVKNQTHLRLFFDDIKSKGGEGLVIRNPELRFSPGRTFDILKVKNEDQFARR